MWWQRKGPQIAVPTACLDLNDVNDFPSVGINDQERIEHPEAPAGASSRRRWPPSTERRISAHAIPWLLVSKKTGFRGVYEKRRPTPVCNLKRKSLRPPRGPRPRNDRLSPNSPKFEGRSGKNGERKCLVFQWVDPWKWRFSIFPEKIDRYMRRIFFRVIAADRQK